MHHPVLLAKLVYFLDDGRGVSLGRCGKDVLEQLGLHVLLVLLLDVDELVVLPDILLALLVWH